MNDCARYRIYFSLCCDFSGGGIFIAVERQVRSEESRIFCFGLNKWQNIPLIFRSLT